MSDDKTKVYAFAAMVDGGSARGARAILRDGTVIAEAIGPVEQTKTDIVIAVKLNRPHARIVWVDHPHQHPELRDVPWGAPMTHELAAPAEGGDEAAKVAMQELHEQFHLCPHCNHKGICKVAAAVDSAPDAMITISACLKHETNEENHDRQDQGTDGEREEESG